MVCLLIDWLYSVFHEVNWKIRPDQSHVEFLYKAINVTEIIVCVQSSLVLVQPRKTGSHPDMTETLLTGT